MSKGRRIGRVKYYPPKNEEDFKQLSVWESKDLYENLNSFPKITNDTFFPR